MKAQMSTKIIVLLMMLSAFFYSYVIMGFFELITTLILIGLFFLFFSAFALLFYFLGGGVYLRKGRNEQSFDIPLRNKKTGIISLLLCLRVLVSIVMNSLRLPGTVFFLSIIILDIISSRVIRLVGNNRWMILDQLSWLSARIIFLFLDFLYYDWVVISLALNMGVSILMKFDLDYMYLKAFIPDIVWLIWIYGTEWMIIVVTLSFINAMYLYVID